MERSLLWLVDTAQPLQAEGDVFALECVRYSNNGLELTWVQNARMRGIAMKSELL